MVTAARGRIGADQSLTAQQSQQLEDGIAMKEFPFSGLASPEAFDLTQLRTDF
jgi:hypothetical protein